MHNDPDAARAYHERTKHSVRSVSANAHRLDWDNQPLPFKIYRDVEALKLPRDLASAALEVPVRDALAYRRWNGDGPASLGAQTLDAQTLARVLYYSAGITKERVYGGDRRFYFRAAPCTGALYHIDVYVACGNLQGLPAGIYHFGPHDFALHRLRAGDHRGALVEATAAEPSVAQAPVVLAFASTFWRNAWKYQARAYRHCWWDSGAMLAHALAVAAAHRLPARVVLGFVDTAVDALFGLDSRREVSLALLALGRDHSAAPRVSGPLEPLSMATAPLSAHEVEYPEMREMHAASSLPDADAVRAWREHATAAADTVHAAAAASARFVARESAGADADVVTASSSSAVRGDAASGEALGMPSGSVALRAPGEPPDAPLGATILRRGSTRRFAREPIALEALFTLLEPAVVPVPFDFRRHEYGTLDEPYILVNAVDGLAAGSYALAPSRTEEENGARSLVLVGLRHGEFRREAGHLGLDQELAADAAVDVFFSSSLDRVLGGLGARGYRAAQLEAAIHGGRVYLAAYAAGLGATGLTFFDDDVTSFFSPHAADKAAMFLVAVGKPRKRAVRSV